MYKFTDWFIEYMKHIDKFCNIKNVINKVCTDDVLKGHYEILDQHSAFISCSLSLDKNAVPLLEKHPDKINWDLSGNPRAIELLKENQDKIYWSQLSRNPNIFTYDYEKMRENCLLFKEDLMKERFHPRNLYKFGSWGHNGGIDDEEEDE